jgi:hypothetical protein
MACAGYNFQIYLSVQIMFQYEADIFTAYWIIQKHLQNFPCVYEEGKIYKNKINKLIK